MNIKYIVDRKALAIRALKKAFCAKVFEKQPGKFKPTVRNFNHTHLDEQAMKWASDLLKKASTQHRQHYQFIVPAHSEAMPLLNAVSRNTHYPIVTNDKEALRRYKMNDFSECMGTWRNLMVTDYLNSGKSCLEAISEIRSVGVRCLDLGVLVDTQQGGYERLKNEGINVYRVLTMEEIEELMAEIRKQPDVPAEEYLPKPEPPKYKWVGCWIRIYDD